MLLYSHLHAKILPGVTIAGLDVDLSGRTAAAAEEAVALAWQTESISATDPNSGFSTTITAPDLGLQLDAAATATSAYQAGRPQQISDWRLLLNLIRHGQVVQPQLALDSAQTEAALHSLNHAYARPPRDAALLFDNGVLKTVPARPGREIDVAATLAGITAGPAPVYTQKGFLLLTGPIMPAIGDDTAAATQARLSQRLNADLTLPLYDPIKDSDGVWTIPTTEWHSWLNLGGSPLAPQWEVDLLAMGQYAQAAPLPQPVHQIDTATAIDRIHSAVLAQLNGGDHPAEPLRLYHSATTHIVGPGETFSSIAFNYGMPYPWLQQANPGVGDSLSVGQSLTIPSPDQFLPLPVLRHKRIVISLSEQKLWAYENGAVKWEWTISSGIPSSPTSPGVYQIRSHQANAYAGNWDLWMPNFMGIYQPVPGADFMNGFHGFPTRHGSNLLWTNSLGTPVTYGCILVGNDQMASLYDWGEAGVVVEIRP